MARQSFVTDKELAFLQALVDNDVDFMIVGLSAAILQGAPAITQGIDLWVRDLEDARFRKALEQVGAVYVPSVGLHPPTLAGASVALFDLVLDMSGLGTFREELEHTLRIDIGGVEVPVLALERVIVSKQAANREKDRLVLPVLRDAAITAQHARKQPQRAMRRRTRGKKSSR